MDSDWFKELFIDEAKAAICNKTASKDNPEDSIPILRSPDGTRYQITIDDSGNLSTTAVQN